MKYDENIVVAVDFDNTLTKGSTYERTGELDRDALRWLSRIEELGVMTVLWTTRDGDDLKEAVDMLAENGVHFDYVNEYPLREGGSKVNVDVYIDDKANDGKIRWRGTYRRIRKLVMQRGVR